MLPAVLWIVQRSENDMGQIKLFAAYNKAAKTWLVLPKMVLYGGKKKVHKAVSSKWSNLVFEMG